MCRSQKGELTNSTNRSLELKGLSGRTLGGAAFSVPVHHGLLASPHYDLNTKHCLNGADADLIMLGLATHELHFTIIRGEFKPNQKRPCEMCGQIGHVMDECIGLLKEKQGERKKRKSRIEREKDEEAGGGDMAWNSKLQSSRTQLQFKPHTQEELRKIYGKRTERNVEVTFGSKQDSESSEEEEGISEEEFKRTEGWKLFKEALDAHTKCNNSAKK
ncbi:uncharacterized protein [Pocillopora verrucosa]|uniref:uncharacterized protein isoform X3 n=1 Tax=Pocillopora verrucosa TaxID=203993 RepID=UPI00333FED40